MNIAEKPEQFNGEADAVRLRTACELIRSAEGLTQKDIADESGIPNGTFTNWLKDTYSGRVDNVNAKVERWLDSRIKNKAAGLNIPDAPEFMALEASGKIEQVLRFAQIMPDMALIVGDAGVGKTSTAMFYAGQNPNVTLVTSHPSISRANTLFGEIARLVGVREKASARLFQAVADVIGKKGHLLVIDEAQHLAMDALEELRALHDLFEVGIVLMGNRSVHSLVTSGHNEGQYTQLFSRFGQRIVLGAPPKADVKILLDKWGVEDKKIRDACALIAAKAGALRGMTKALRMAHVLASMSREELAPKHIDAAFKRLSNRGAK